MEAVEGVGWRPRAVACEAVRQKLALRTFQPARLTAFLVEALLCVCVYFIL